jgi:chromate transporter
MLGTLLRIFIAFAKVGIFGYGGGPSMIPLMQREVVNEQHWLNEEDFIDTLALGNALPGPIATKMSAYIGYKLSGLAGAVAGVGGTVLPSMIAMLILGLFFLQFRNLPQSQAALKAVRPAVVALLAWTAWDIAPSGIKGWDTALIAIVSFVAVTFANVHPALVILLTAILGIAVYR